MGYVKKYGREREIVDENITRRMRFARSIKGYRHTLRMCNITAFPGNDGYANVPHFYIYP
jgi:hypothetical protein